MRATTLAKIKDFKDTAQAYGFEVTTSTPVTGGFLLEATNGGEYFELVWDSSGRFHYGPSYFGTFKVRNLSDASRYLARFTPVAVDTSGMTRAEFKIWALENVSLKSDNALGYKARYVASPFTPNHAETRCSFCPGSVKPFPSVMVAAFVKPVFRTFPEISLKKISVEYRGACDSCAPKYVASH